jgi:hypothetical protein
MQCHNRVDYWVHAPWQTSRDDDVCCFPSYSFVALWDEALISR